ncbi:MAG: hypothetical protein RLZZ244_1249 [Verrucomicrobiota bacterium]|jgi:hypothetical protein
MKTPRLLALAALLLAPTARAEVVRPAPDFPLHGFEKSRSLKSFQGQPVVVLFADSPTSRAFRSQLRELESSYGHFASRKVLFVAAFRKHSADPVQSNIPFVLATSGKDACQSFAVQSPFAIAILGADGNLDYLTNKPLQANRIREVLQNSFTVQKALRQKQLTPER